MVAALGFVSMGHPSYGAGLVAFVSLNALKPRRRLPRARCLGEWCVPLVALVALVLKAIGWTRFRVHVMGDLPSGSVVIVANHAHDADSMVLPVTLAVRRGLRHPLISSASSRLLEPGFLAERMPPILGQWIAGLNLSAILWAIGVRPIEDAPLSHSLKSWAYLIYQFWGDRPLIEVFEETAIPQSARRRSLSYFWTRRGWRGSQARHAVRVLKDPYRRWVRDHTRAVVESQIAVLREAASRGFAIYTTPEGRLTTDGRITRFRVSWSLLIQDYRGSVVIAATSYDLMRRGRLHLWTVLAPLKDPTWAQGAVARMRPITASHVVAYTWLSTSDHRWQRLCELAVNTYAQLPRYVVIAQNLRDHPERVIKQRCRWLLKISRRGLPVRDKRFPHVDDILAYYANQMNEILSAGGTEMRSGSSAEAGPFDGVPPDTVPTELSSAKDV